MGAKLGMVFGISVKIVNAFGFVSTSFVVR
jgi:hypothetical protein